jgi:hypothetical protein
MEPDDRKGFLYILIFAAIVYGVVRLCVLADPHPPFHRLGAIQTITALESENPIS